MNTRTIKKQSVLWFIILFSLLFSACSVKLVSVVSRDYNAENKNILIVMSYHRHTKKIVETFEREFMLLAVNSKNKIDFFIIPPSMVSETDTLELNKVSDVRKVIDAKIAEVNADMVISIVAEHHKFVNNDLTYVRYLATGRETVGRTEVWKSRIELNLGQLPFTQSPMSKKMATEFYDKLVSDGIIQQKQ